SLGEFLALTVSFEHFAETHNNPKAAILGETLDAATGTLLVNGKSPSRLVGELDNRGSHFYLALYWAQELAKQDKDQDLKAHFSMVAKDLESQEDTIVKELISVQGKPANIGGYYAPSDLMADSVMRPSSTFSSILDPVEAMA